jgi:glucokinase
MTGPSLVADVGGTNTRCALADGRRLRDDSIRRYANADFLAKGQNLDSVIATFIEETGASGISGAAVALAGPVRGGRGELTNIPFDMSSARLAEVTGAARTEVLNDLQAQGYALDDLRPGTVRTILPGKGIDPTETRLVIGAGTGFNIAPVFEGRGGRIVPPAEAGHVTLPQRTDADVRLARFLEAECASAHGFASVEEVLSGRGLENVWRWHAAEAGAPAAKSARDIMAGLADGSDPRAAETAAVYVRTLGNVTGNLALTLLPYGGIYFIGGVVRAMTPFLARFGFAEAMRDKARFDEFIDQFAVSVVEDDFAALTGCAVMLEGLSPGG